MVITLVLCVLLFLERLTGEIAHVVLGMILVVITVAHLCRQMKKMKHQKLPIRVVDQILIAATLVMVFSGIMMHPLHGVMLHPLHGVMLLKILHKLSAVVFVVGIIIHMVQHKERKK